MANLKYICLSDLHLGARYSILHHTSDKPGDDPKPSAVLTALTTAILSLVKALPTGTPAPQLLLNGDVLELALGPTNQAAMDFQFLMSALFVQVPGGPPPLPSSNVLYVPGNHDHFVWRWAEDDNYIQQIGSVSGKIPPLTPIAPLFAPAVGQSPGIASSFLTTLLHKSTTASVQLMYPNFFDQLPNGGRCVVFHHGHFIESAYRMMSEVSKFLRFDGPVLDAVQLERENGAWIDFMWSTFGDAGAVGFGAEELYDRLQDPFASEQFIRPLAKRLVARWQADLPMGGERQVQLWARRVIRAALDLIMQRAGDLERSSYQSVLTQDSIDGLTWYLDTILAQQFGKNVPSDLVFIFGHTHKPFEDALPVASYQEPVRIFNTGGWVLDEPTMTSLEGASLVLVDADNNVVSIRLFNQPVNDPINAVTILPSGAYPQPPNSNPLLTAVQSALQPSQWTSFSTAVAKALADRQKLLIDELDLATMLPVERPGR